MYDVCEENGLGYTFGIASNARLKVLAEELLQRAIDGYNKDETKQRLFTHFEYQADSWSHPRTVVAKAECQAAGTNLRFVVTSLDVSTDDEARQIYDDYIQRGESEQRTLSVLMRNTVTAHERGIEVPEVHNKHPLGLRNDELKNGLSWTA